MAGLKTSLAPHHQASNTQQSVCQITMNTVCRPVTNNTMPYIVEMTIFKQNSMFMTSSTPIGVLYHRGTV